MSKRKSRHREEEEDLREEREEREDDNDNNDETERPAKGKGKGKGKEKEKKGKEKSKEKEKERDDIFEDEEHEEEGDQAPVELQFTKRQKTQAGDYIPGSIMRIHLVDFVTYDRAEYIPGPNLNMIIGPNGTGKSTLVCAICLGLGGKTSLLGRAKDIKDFVKHGKEKAIIEIELKTKGREKLVIRRTFGREKNTSTWKIDGIYYFNLIYFLFLK